MKICLALMFCLFGCSAAFASGTSMSLGGYYGYVPLKDNGTFNLGFSFYAPIVKSIGWWTWNGFGSTSKDEDWVSHVQGFDWSYQSLTTTLQYKISNNPNEIDNAPFEQEIGVKVKVKLW